ncbi:hypothetical protein SADUNF_Sadunf03G0005400 [Salix dunnii]|uniref:Probable magnesium transporter n=1 Tax=Salix dunnii TaxID=1413687 RepID=A0A835N444_9ROSI|nr:hypothetical protein SADUNF_Sadunf03G0005400 [Salix dunnii]
MLTDQGLGVLNCRIMAMESGSWKESYKGMSADNIKGLVLALSSSVFIGASFIVKKKGLKKAGASGIRAGSGGYTYLYEPLWWVGMITMIVGEIANFAAYAFAPAILVTPLGLNILLVCSAALAHIILREKLHIFGILGCVLCVVGSTTIVLHAPQEREIESVKEVWDLATEPGSLSVMSVKALGIALKLTLSGTNQLMYPQTWVFAFVVITCVLTQMNYLNKQLSHSPLIIFLVFPMQALDTFNTAVVSPIYYVMFTSLTILASVIMFKVSKAWNLCLSLVAFWLIPFQPDGDWKIELALNFSAFSIFLSDWDRQSPTQIVTEMCGFMTILSGTFLLHRTKDMADGSPSLPVRLSKHTDEDGFGTEGIPLRRQDSSRAP